MKHLDVSASFQSDWDQSGHLSVCICPQCSQQAFRMNKTKCVTCCYQLALDGSVFQSNLTHLLQQVFNRSCDTS